MKNDLKAGAGKADITPRSDLYPFPFALFFMFEKLIYPIYVQTLWLESGAESILFVAFEMTYVPNPKEMLPYLSELSGLKESHILACATHTHCAPLIGDVSQLDAEKEDDRKILSYYEDLKKAVKDKLDPVIRTV